MEHLSADTGPQPDKFVELNDLPDGRLELTLPNEEIIVEGQIKAIMGNAPTFNGVSKDAEGTEHKIQVALETGTNKAVAVWKNDKLIYSAKSPDSLQ